MSAVCVFCGSSSGARPNYVSAARALGTELARGGHRLVYGGASVGLMGELATAALAAGGEVIGVIPEALVAREVAHLGLTELLVVQTMHERKATMARLSDGFVALPGGLGTLDETFDVLTWASLGLHGKPFVLLDVDGYWQPLVALLDHGAAEGFVSPTQRALVRRATDAPGALDALFPP